MQYNRKYSYDTKVGACADYLLDIPTKLIEEKWGVPATIVVRWVKERGCFKLRTKEMEWALASK